MKDNTPIGNEKAINFSNGRAGTEFIDALKTIDYAIFDFDGTLYPHLFIFDLTKDIFMQHANEETYKEKLVNLGQIAEIYKNGDFEEAYSKFIGLMKGESKEEFKKNAEKMISNTYPYAKLTIKKLREKYGIRSYLISLTADFIAEVAKKQFDFEETFSVKYVSKNHDAGNKFTGDTLDPIQDQQSMKKAMLQKLMALEHNRNKDKFICFFDSSDDIPIAEIASLRVGVNPKPELSKHISFDLILVNREDPWKEIYNII